MRLKLKDILPNPYRDLKSNPLIEDKILELIESINRTTFWDNVVVRKNKQGEYELAHGHHRVAAAIRAGLTEANFIVREFTDAQMIQSMDSENRETYQSNPASMVEAVKAVVSALVNEAIPAFNIAKHVRKETLRYAPSYAPGVTTAKDAAVPYTALKVAEFLGRTKSGGKGREVKAEDSVVAALDALHLMAIGRFTRAALEACPNISKLKQACDTIKHSIAQENLVRQPIAQRQAEEIARKAEQDRVRHAEALEQKKKQAEINRLAAAAGKEEDDRKAAAIVAQRRAKQQSLEEAEKRSKEYWSKVKKEEDDRAKKEANEAAAVERKLDRAARQLVESLMSKIERMHGDASELSPLAKAVQRNTKISMREREELYRAANDLGDWCKGWLASQFAAPLTGGKREVEDMRKREVSKRKLKGEDE